MHMADALLSPGIAGVMYVLSGTAACLAARKVKTVRTRLWCRKWGYWGPLYLPPRC